MHKASEPDLSVIDGDNIISVNARKKLGEIEKKYPNMEIIIGRVEENDKAISLDLAEMEHSRQVIFDAATETVLGKRVDRLMKPRKEPLMAYVIIISFLAGIAACFFVYNI